MLIRVDAPEGYEALYDLREPEIGLRAFIAIHSSARGPAFGGIRRRAYADAAQAQAEALALAESMSFKCALAGLAAGGAKSVIIDGPDLDVTAAYGALGRAVQSLEGRYVCGPDVGTSPQDLLAVRAMTSWVNPVENDAGLSTARGVLAALRGALGEGEASDRLEGLRVGVEGLGAVGRSVASMLVTAGVQVFGFDPDALRAREAQARGVELAVSAAALRDLQLDVWMPCALGRSITSELVSSIKTDIICGSANNQLAAPALDAELHTAGVRWVPDFLANVGAVAEGVITVELGQGPEARKAVDECFLRIEGTSRELIRRAQSTGRPTGALALESARSGLI